MPSPETSRRTGRASRVRGAVARRVGVDARALAALRIALAVLLLADLLVRATDLVAFYTDAGVLPRATLHRAFPAIADLSVHALSGGARFQAALFVLAAAVALSLLVGYHTRLATVASLLLLVSLHARNPLLLNAGDALLRRLLLWGTFLPLGGRWSVDSLRGSEAPDRVANLASAALLLQVVVVYAANAAFKLRGELWRSGEAIRYVFGLDHLTVLAGDALANHPALLVALDRAWLAMIVASALLVVLRGRPRAAFAGAFAAAHLGMALTLRLGLFPLISIAALLPFLPGSAWDLIEGSLQRTVGTPIGRVGRGLDRQLPDPSIPPVRGLLPRGGERTTTAVVAVLLALLIVWNGATLGLVGLPAPVESSVDPTEYRWDMFAPEPRTVDGWYVVPGRLESGERVDAFHGGPVSWDRPPELAATYPGHRWFVYLLDLRAPANAPLRDEFGAYLCRRWNRAHDDDLLALAVYYVEVPVRLEGAGESRRVELLRHSCGGG